MPGPQERTYLVMPTVPTNLSKIFFNWQDWYDTVSGTIEYSATNLTNGIGIAPTFTTNGFPAIFTSYTLIDSNGNTNASQYQYSYQAEDGGDIFVGYGGPFSTADRAVLIDQNLKFLLREATPTVPFSYFSSLAYNGLDYGDSSGPWETGQPEYYYARNATSTNYEYYGPRRYIPDYGYSALFIGGPIQENFMWRNFVFNAGDFATNAAGTGGTFDSGQGMRAAYYPLYVFTGDPTQSPAALAFSTTNSPFLIEGLLYDNPGNPLVSDVGVTIDDGWTYTAPSNVKNCFGLALQNVSFWTNVVFPGNSCSFSVADQLEAALSVNFADPLLYPVDFYFASQSAYILGTGPLTPVPGAPGFSPTNTSPLLITAVGQPITVAGWAKEEILNGYSGKYAYAEQYFDKAYMIDTNGNVTTNQTGVLSPFGEFYPTQPGATALVTMPEVNSGLRGTAVVYVVKLQLDVNHDGTMDASFAGPDNTTASQPYVFWVNNDCDAPANLVSPERDVNNPLHPDYSLQNIPSQRDLEDWSRLWICGLPASTNYQVTLSWTNIQSGYPAINLVMPVETNGGTLYLTDTNISAEQAGGTSVFSPSYKFARITTSNSYTFPASYLTNNGTNFFLFEGAGIGNGQLIMTISQGTNIITTASAFMNLQDVKDMFEHAHIQNGPPSPPYVPFTDQSTFTNDNYVPVDPNEGTNVIVFVHGWRLPTWTAENFAQTMFKRLWWQGYQGCFAALRWPTLSSETDGPAIQYLTFNRDEFIAFNCAQGTANYFLQFKSRFPNYNINACAHSHGNVLMMEVLKNFLASGQKPIHNYALLQAAVAAECLDTNAPIYSGFTFEDTLPDSFYGYAGSLQNAVSGKLFNFYNTNDFGVVTCWQPDQLLLKPDGRYYYQYLFSSPVQTPVGSSRTITDPHELMAFMSRPHTQAVGAVPGLGASLSTPDQVDLTALVGFTDNWLQHSGEFNWNIQTLQPFYQTLLDDLQ